MTSRLPPAVRAAAGTAAIHALRATPLRAGLAVCYHAVGDPPGDPGGELLPSLGSALFRAQVRHLGRHFRLVRASELREAVASRARGGRFPLAITFDDDLASHLAVAAPVLREEGATGTFYLNGTFFDHAGWHWWELVDRLLADGAASHALARALRLPGASRVDSVHGLGACVEALDPAGRDRATEALHDLAGRPLPPQRLREIDAARLGGQGHEIGFHTKHHHPLTGLTDEELGDAMRVGARRILALPGAAATLAYPHGKHDRRVMRAARASGWQTGYTTTHRAVTTKSPALALGRVDAPFTSVAELTTRLALALARARDSTPGRQAPAPRTSS